MPQCRVLRGAHKAPLLCVNISPLILVTSRLLHPEQAGHHDPTTGPPLWFPVSEKPNRCFGRRAPGWGWGGGGDPRALSLRLWPGCGSPAHPQPPGTGFVTLGPSQFLPEPLLPSLQSGDNNLSSSHGEGKKLEWVDRWRRSWLHAWHQRHILGGSWVNAGPCSQTGWGREFGQMTSPPRVLVSSSIRWG